VTRRTRGVLGLVALAGLGGLLIWAIGGLNAIGHPPGPNARDVPLLVAHERHVANVVNGVTYDVRGTDTLGEELILMAAAIGVSILLRGVRDPDEVPVAEGRGPGIPGPLRVLGAVLVGPVVVLGVYVVTHGQLSPGGGFQGGVVLAAAFLLVYAAGQLVALERLRPVDLVEIAEAVGALAFALVGLGGLVFSGALLANFIGLAPMGSLLSGGTVPVLSIATGVEVTAGLTLILTELLDQALLGTRAR
jgi:multicomponent Na+:H+ antiporter subunit B